MSIKGKRSIGLKLDDRYVAILEIAVEKMKADGIRSASKANIMEQALELYAKENKIDNDNIRSKLQREVTISDKAKENRAFGNTIKQKADNPEKGTARALLRHYGKWAGDDGEEILKLIEETRSDAEF